MKFYFSQAFWLHFHDKALAYLHTEACLLKNNYPNTWKIRMFSINCFCYRMADKWLNISIDMSGCLVLLKYINRAQKTCCSTLCSMRHWGWFTNWLSNRIWWKCVWLKHKFGHTSRREESTSFNINISSLHHSLSNTCASLCYNIQDI